MRWRCFFIAAMALLVGIYYLWSALPSDFVIEQNKKNIRTIREHNESIRNADTTTAVGRTLSSMPLGTIPDDYPIVSSHLNISFVSFGIAGVLLIVGFIIGPPKEGANAQTKVVDPVE